MQHSKNVFDFRKIDPASNAIASEGLSKSKNADNMRKMRVNAQITAVTSILEIAGNIVQWAIWILITKFVGLGSLIQSILLYFVVLPYVFLMNKSHNKNRIIEDGWINVLKNAIGTGRIFRIRKTSVKIDIQPFDSKAAQNMIDKKDNIVTPPTLFRKIFSKQNSRVLPISENNGGIKTISTKPIDEKHVKEDKSTLTICMPSNDEIPSCSPISSLKYHQEPREHKIKQCDSIDGLKGCRHEMILNLLENVKDEEVYIRSFRELVGYEESVERDKDSSSEVEDQSEAQGRKTDSSEAIKELNVAKLTDTIYLHPIETAELTYDDMLGTNFKGLFQDRMVRRRGMIKMLLKSMKNGEDSYKSCLEMFIDLEENLIEV